MPTDETLKKQYPSMYQDNSGGDYDSAKDSAIQLSEEEKGRLQKLYPKMTGTGPDSSIYDRRTGQRISDPAADYQSKRNHLESTGKQTFNNADLSQEDLYRAQLDRKEFNSASFDGSNLAGGSMRFSNVRGASFDRADLTEVDFFGADLRGADLSKAKGDFVDLSNARIDETTKLPSREFMRKNNWKL